MPRRNSKPQSCLRGYRCNKSLFIASVGVLFVVIVYSVVSVLVALDPDVRACVLGIATLVALPALLISANHKTAAPEPRKGIEVDELSQNQRDSIACMTRAATDLLNASAAHALGADVSASITVTVKSLLARVNGLLENKQGGK